MENLTPVKVDINIESLDTSREAFYNLCFITENNEAPRTLVISNLKELLDNGYTRDSLAYNFCVGVFSQQAMPVIYIRAKRFNESYEDAFLVDSNRDFYFIIIESKDISTISSFSSFMATQDNQKMLFYSNSLDTKLSNKSVGYYQEFSLSGSLNIDSSDYYIDKSYGANYSERFASHPYPFLTEKEDAYQPNVIPLNITLIRVLQDATINSDAYTPRVEPLDITLRSILNSKYIDGNDAYMPSVKPIDITLKSLLMSKNIDDKDAYQPSVKPLDITLKRVLIKHTVKDKDAYIPSVKPLDIILKKGI